MNKPLLSSIGAFTLWGLIPIYWKLFEGVSGYDLFNYRMLFSITTLWTWMLLTGKAGLVKKIWLSSSRYWLILSGLLICTNWYLYIVAVAESRVVEASMGYFLNPLINVLFGWIFLKEELRLSQWPAIILASCGVAVLFFYSQLQTFPWYAFLLCLTFAGYGLIRKKFHVGSMEGLTYETSMVFLPFMLLWIWKGGSLWTPLSHLGWGLGFLLAASGIVSSLPLLLFSYAAKNLKLQTIGLTQYLSPSLKFICGWAIFHEHIPSERWVAFFFIWSGLAWYTLESFLFLKKIMPKNKI